MVAPVTFKSVDPFLPDTDEGQDRHLRQLSSTVRGIMDGKINAAQDFALAVAPAVQTVVPDERVAESSRVILTAADDAAAVHLASGTVRISAANITTGSFTIDHVSSPVARTFRASILS